MKGPNAVRNQKFSQKLHLSRHQSRSPKKAPSHLFSSLVMIAGIFVLAAAAFFLLTRSLTISEKQMEINELKAEIEELYTTRDAKIATYNGSVDMVEIATRAAEYGMHKPTADQITFVD